MGKIIDLDRLQQAVGELKEYVDSKEVEVDLSGIEKDIELMKAFMPVSAPDTEDYIIMQFNTDSDIEIGMAGRNGGTKTFGLAYNWDIYLNGDFAGNFTGVTSATQTITIPNEKAGLHNVYLKTNLTNKDYFARSIAFRGSASIGSYDKLISVKGYGKAFNGTSAMPNYCYYAMFQGCTQLANAPALPATTLADSCYFYMFSGCKKLVIAPELPATTLADSCYFYMFSGCTKLVIAPELPATTLAYDCYHSMFYGCTNLVNAPELPAMTLATSCYNSMFQGCTQLANTPALPATTLAASCYSSMFQGCTQLANTPALPATTLAASCYSSMFSGCKKLVIAPELPATTLADVCYENMFSGCTKLTEVKCHYTSNLTSIYAQSWLNNITTTGRLYSPNAVITYGLPSKWTAQPL